MINSIEGKLTDLTLNEAIISTGSGIEFSVLISSQTASSIMSFIKSDKNVKLYTILIHREDSMRLVGFSTKLERRIFEELNSISGIGIKQALKILSGFSASEFVETLDKGDVKKLSSIPGLGVKTAQKILIMLREKLVEVEEKQPKAKALEPIFIPYTDIINAATDMGYDKDNVKAVLSNILEKESDELDALSDSDKEKYLFKKIIAGLSNG